MKLRNGTEIRTGGKSELKGKSIKHMYFDWIPLESDLPSDDDLGEIKVSNNANRSDWEPYPKEVRKHSERNHPRFVEELIKVLSPMRGRVHDPMCGIGTVLHEAAWLGRIATGWDIRKKWRSIIAKRAIGVLQFQPPEGTVDLVLSSPSYSKMNHKMGSGEKQKQVKKSPNSTQGTEMHETEDLSSFDLSSSKTLEEWKVKFWPVLDRCLLMLKPGGKLALIVKEKVVDQKPEGVLKATRLVAQERGFIYLGYYWRSLQPSGLRRAQGKKFFEDTGRNPVFPDKEVCLVFKRWTWLTRSKAKGSLRDSTRLFMLCWASLAGSPNS